MTKLEAVKSWQAALNHWCYYGEGVNTPSTITEVKAAFNHVTNNGKRRCKGSQNLYIDVFFKNTAGAWHGCLDTADREEMAYFIDRLRRGETQIDGLPS